MDNQDKDSQETTFCIVSTGRSGSSLLAHIMAEAGADFKLDWDEDWSALKGDMEHEFTHAAYADLHRHKLIKSSILPRKLFSPPFKKRFNRTVKKMASINFLKSSRLVYLVPYIARYNKKVKVIVIYRDFWSIARSLHAKYGWNYQRLVEFYIDAYKTALIQLEVYGGVVLDFDDIMTKESFVPAANSISELTGLSEEALSSARDKVVSKPTQNKHQLDIEQFQYQSVTELESYLKQIKNKIF